MTKTVRSATLASAIPDVDPLRPVANRGFERLGNIGSRSELRAVTLPGARMTRHPPEQGALSKMKSKKKVSRYVRPALAILASLSLASCGGGGGTNPSSSG